jgi:hypothetical protein
MPHARFKSENYENFGGINAKASPYLTGPREFLNIVNYDFSTPGGLTGRPGSTQFFGTTFAGGVNFLTEFVKSNGTSQIMIGSAGGLWSAINTVATGISTAAIGATVNEILPSGPAVGFSMALLGILARGATLSQGASYVIDSVAFQDWLYLADGNNFMKYSGASLYRYGVPYGTIATLAKGYTTGAGFSPLGTGLSAIAYKFAYVNNRGIMGPTHKYQYVIGANHAPLYPYGIDNVLFAFGTTINWVTFGLTIPAGYGISQIAIFKAAIGISDNTYQTVENNFKGVPFRLHALIDAGASLFTDIYNIGENSQPVLFEDNSVMPFEKGTGMFEAYRPTYYPGQSFIAISDWDYDCPKYLEIFAGRMFMSGFDKNPNDFTYSDDSEPERFFPENRETISSADGDIINGMRAFYGRLIVGKFSSIHELTGNNPQNLATREITNEYGVMNNRCYAQWADKMWMLDRRGIVEYNGANIGIISEKMDPIFATMNLTAARKEALMMHVKERNEIWCSIPTNGATLNNLTVVFDYKANAWTTFEGFSPKSFEMLKGRNAFYTAMFGDNSGRVNEFGASYFGDNGAGISVVAQARFEHPEGQSVEKMFRRLFVNIEKLQGGATTTLGVYLRTGYSSAIGYTRSIVMSKYQKNINFGLSSKSLSVEVGFNSSTERIRYYGYTLEYRWQRNQ